MKINERELKILYLHSILKYVQELFLSSSLMRTIIQIKRKIQKNNKH